MPKFYGAMVEKHGKKYLRDSMPDELDRMELSFRKIGFPGCIGAADCADWVWKNCPVGWQGHMTGKDNEPVIRLEMICDLDLRIWAFQIGFPGSFNDINILIVSNHFSRVLLGTFLPVAPQYSIYTEVFFGTATLLKEFIRVGNCLSNRE